MSGAGLDGPAPAQAPVIPGFHPDPSVCRVGDDYFVVCSSFEYAPGVPIFRSTDLRAWEQIGNVLTTPSQAAALVGAAPSTGVFAPTLRYHDGRFWMITTILTDGGGHLLVHADDPRGPWSAPVRFPTLAGIDPDLCWDDDGTCLLSWAGFGEGSEGIQQVAIDPETGEVLSDKRHLWSGTGGKFPEGPHLYRRGDHWYLLIAEGGTERGHAVTVARGPSPSGPFEPCPTNPVLTRRGSDLPVQSTGHADLVELVDGSWAMVYHGVRPRGTSPEWHVLGRETYVDRVEWHDGWPVLTGHLRAPDRVEAWTDELAAPQWPASWVGAGRFPADVVTRTPDGWQVRSDDASDVFVGRRQDALHVRVVADVAVDGDSVGGIAVRVDPQHQLGLECTGDVVRAVLRVGDVRSVLGERHLDAGDRLEIRTQPSSEPFWSVACGPDRVGVGVATADGFVELGSVDGRYLSTEVAGGMTGRMVGVTCSDGRVLVRRFSYLGSGTADGTALAT
ncbi:MAG: glycoside hydrolase family 43 protein [Cellulomonadaceae bacterium]|nr:glycoside hydrolase family 43 protein [Cellulomonadaceae bacterium]